MLENSPTLKKVMAALARRASLSAAELTVEASVSHCALVNGAYLKALKDAGHIFIAGWGKNPNGFTIALCRPGSASDCPRPRFEDINRDSMGFALVVEALKLRNGQTYSELAKAANLSINTVRSRGYMKILLRKQRVHICDWRRSRGGNPCLLYALGPGRSVQKPEPLTKKRFVHDIGCVSPSRKGCGRRLVSSLTRLPS